MITKRTYQFFFACICSYTLSYIWMGIEALFSGTIQDSPMDNIIMLLLLSVFWVLGGFVYEVDEYRTLKEKAQKKTNAAVLESLYRFRDKDGFRDVVVFHMEEKAYTVNEMISELEQETKVGYTFASNIYDTVITHMRYFKPEEGESN